jgi:hypothetical protein
MYRTLESSTYTDPKVKKLPSDGKFLFVYLITNEMTHITGLYHAPYVLVSSQTGIPLKRLKDLLDRLQELKLVLHDDESEVVWVVNMMKYQLHSSKILRPGLAHLRSLHAPELILGFLTAYGPELSTVDSYPKMLSKYQDMYIRKYGYAYADPEIYISGFSQKPGYVPVSVSVSVSGPVPVPVPGSVKEEKTVVVDQNFVQNPQLVLDLWDELVVPLKMPKAPKLTKGLAQKILTACEVFPDRQAWASLFMEYARSKWLRGLTGDRKKREFFWLMSREYDGTVENYTKVASGKYRDQDEPTISGKTSANIEAVNRMLAKYGQSLDGDANEPSNGHGSLLQGLHEAGDEQGDRDQRGAPGDLLLRPVGLPPGARPGGDGVGEAEPDPVPDDRGAENLPGGQ